MNRNQTKIYSMPAFKTVNPTITSHISTDANNRFGFTVPHNVLKKELRSLNPTLTESFVFWDQNGAPYLLAYAPLQKK